MTDSTHFTAGNTPDAPRSDLPDLLDALAADLRGVGYTVDGVAELLGAAAHSRPQPGPADSRADCHRRGRATGSRAAALAAVVRLWLLADPQETETLDAALPGVRTAGPAGAGPLEPAAEGLIRAKVDLRPYGWDGAAAEGAQGEDAQRENTVSSGGAELWVASDLAAHQRPGVLRHDHVLGIGQASTTLVQVTARRHVARALDLAPAAASRPSTCCTTPSTSRRPTSRSAPSRSPGSTCCSTPGAPPGPGRAGGPGKPAPGLPAGAGGGRGI